MVRKGFTLVELMIVILIVAILAAVAIPLMTGRIDAAKWSEAKSAMGTIGTGIRAYYAEHGCTAAAPTASDWAAIGIGPTDLNGNYFVQGDYSFSNCACNAGTITYQVDCGRSKDNAPTVPATMRLTVAAAAGGGTTATWSDGTTN